MAFDPSFLVPQMSSTEIDVEKIEMQVLKVHIHCDGCKRKVKKLLRQIEGVFEVEIDREQQKVIITGTADIDTVIKKLIKAGKHAEIWASNEDQNPRSNNWFSRDFGLETNDKGIYSGFGFYDGTNRSTVDNTGSAYEGDVDIRSNMMPNISIGNIDGENAGFDDLYSFKYPSSLVKMMNMQGRERNQTVPTMTMNANMNNREMPQYTQEINNINSRYMQELNNVDIMNSRYVREMNNVNNMNQSTQEIKNMNNLVIPQQMQEMGHMNQMTPQYTPEMNNMNNRLMPRYMQEIGNLNNRVMPRYIREAENMNGHVMPKYTQEMNYMTSQLMSHHIQEMSNMNNPVMPQYMQDMKNMNSHVRLRDRYENQLPMMDYASPFLPDYYTVPYPYRFNHNHNSFS